LSKGNQASAVSIAGSGGRGGGLANDGRYRPSAAHGEARGLCKNLSQCSRPAVLTCQVRVCLVCVGISFCGAGLWRIDIEMLRVPMHRQAIAGACNEFAAWLLTCEVFRSRSRSALFGFGHCGGTGNECAGIGKPLLAREQTKNKSKLECTYQFSQLPSYPVRHRQTLHLYDDATKRKE
jgi:hypothetical protein